MATASDIAPPAPFSFGAGPKGWFRAITSFFGVLTLILIAIQFIYAMYRQDINDPDIWWHMRDAQLLLEHQDRKSVV